MMNWDDYMSEVKYDAVNHLEENLDYYKDMNWYEIEEDLFLDDAVTGNASGSYTFCTVEAQENVAGVIWDEEVIDRFIEWGYNGVPLEKGPEAIDVIVRCMALYEVSGEIENAFKDMLEK